MVRRGLTTLVVALALVAGGLLAPAPARAFHGSIRGVVTDATSGAALPDVCVTPTLVPIPTLPPVGL